MSTKSNTMQVILDIIQEGAQKGILHLSTDNKEIRGNLLSIKKKK